MFDTLVPFKKLKALSLFFHFQTKDILEIHEAKCPNFNTDVQVSLDAVSECRSNSNSLHVYSTRFSQCRVIYPVQIVRPIGKFRLDNQKYLDDFLADVCCNNCRIQCFIGDSAKRATARASKGHSSYYPCEYCESKGLLLYTLDKSFQSQKLGLQKQKQHILNQIAHAEATSNQVELASLQSLLQGINDSIKSMNKKNNNIVWPASTQNGSERTIQKVLDIVERLDQNDVLSLDEAKGILGRSLFLDIPYFNYVQDIPTEYLHCRCIGVVKRLVELTFDVGENRQRNTARKLSSILQFNALMLLILVPREFSRRARALDFSVFKGQEFRNIILFFFPLVLICIEVNAKERRLWLLLAYMIRACILPDAEYQNLDPNVIEYCEIHFYKLYEQLFNARNCSYNTHLIGSHLKIMRCHGPLTLTSAFGFESFYGEVRHSFVPGTISPLKQVLQKVFLKRALSHHSCKSPIYYSPKETACESNSLIYTFKDSQYSIYKINSIEDDTFECFKVGKYDHSFPETPTMNWAKVGVFEAGGISDEIEFIDKKIVSGKVLKVDNLYLTCPINVLEEK